MQGYFGAALTQHRHEVAGAADARRLLFVLSPVLVARLGHDTLCAHWLLLGLFYVAFREYADAHDVRRGTRLATLLAALAASIHPYLATMSATLACAAYLRLWRAQVIGFARALRLIATTLAIMFAVMYTIGYFTKANVGTVGFETYAADLVTLIDGAGHSRVMPDFHLVAGRWEGYGFLGLGAIVGLGLAVIAWVRTRARPPRGAWILVLCCLLMAVYALSAKVTLANEQVGRLHHVFDHLDIITKPFRASGRFIWPLHYLMMLTAVWGAAHVFGSLKQTTAVAGVALAAIVAAQAIDLRPDLQILADKNFRQAPHVALEPADGHYRHLAIFPAQILGACGGLYEEDYVYRFMLEAYRLHTTYNSGVFARVPLEQIQRSCGDFYRAVDAGQLDPQTIYVVAPWTMPHMKELGAACGRFDGDWLCVSRDSDEVFRTYLDTGKIVPRKSP